MFKIPCDLFRSKTARCSWASVSRAFVLLVGLGALGFGPIDFGGQASAEEEDISTKEFDVVTVQLVDETALANSSRLRIDVPFIGYPGAGKVHRRITQRSDGLFAVENLKPGTHLLMATDARARGYWRRFFEIEFPASGKKIEVPLVAAQTLSRPKKSPRVGEVTTRIDGFDVRPSIRFEVENENDAAWPIGDFPVAISSWLGTIFAFSFHLVCSKIQVRLDQARNVVCRSIGSFWSHMGSGFREAGREAPNGCCPMTRSHLVFV